VSPIGKGLDAYIHRQVTEIALNQLAEAREEAERIKVTAQKELEQQQAQLAKELEEEIAKQRQRALVQARLEQQRLQLQVREQYVQEIWGQVEQKLRSIAAESAAYREQILASLLVDAAEQLQKGDLEFQVSAHDLELVSQEFCAHVETQLNNPAIRLHLIPAAADIWGGVLVFRRDSNLMVDNSFDARFALVKSMLHSQVLKMLESDENRI